MTQVVDQLARIVERKRVEVARRLRRRHLFAALAQQRPPPCARWLHALRRPIAGAPRVIAEIKLRSPSAGQIRARRPGEVARIAEAYQAAGAAAVSVLCDGPGFGGSPLDVARVAKRVSLPILFKEFVLDEVQLDAARAAGAELVLLLVRVLPEDVLQALIEAARMRGLEPVVEAADADELACALRTTANIVGVNARDLRSFRVDTMHAASLVDRIPPERIAVLMSGVRTPEDFARAAATRADAVLIGEGLMRASDPGAALLALTGRSSRH